jgi:hypothetical protein
MIKSTSADTAHSKTRLSSGSSFISLMLIFGSISVAINAIFATAFSTVFSLSLSLFVNFSLFKTPSNSFNIFGDMNS